VPAGNVAVVRDVSLTNGDATSHLMGIGVGGLAVLLSFATIASAGILEWQGHHVLNPGDSLHFYSAGGSLAGIASGYLLVLP